MSDLSFADFMGGGPAPAAAPSGTVPLGTLYQVESGGNRNAVNPGSGARGPGQVIPSTWSKMGGGDPTDPAEQDRVSQKVWETHSKDLSAKLGKQDLPDWQKYLAYQQGPTGAHALLTAEPGTTAIAALTPIYGNAATARKAVLGNGGKEGTTTGEFVQLVRGRWEKGGGKTLLDKAAAAPTSSSSGVSFEDFMGMPKKPPSTLDNVKGWMKDEVLPALGSGLKSGAELLAAGPGMLVGAVAGGAKSAEEMVKGTPRREALQAGAETAGRVGAALNPVTVASHLLGYTPEPSVVDTVMEKLGKGIHHYGEAIESQYRYPNGQPVLMAEDVDAFANMLMGVTGAKVTKAGVDKVVNRLTADKAPPTDSTRETYKGGETPAPMTPEEVLKAQTIGPKATAQEHINESLGIKSTKEREAYTRQRAKDVRTAFRNDPDFADYLRFQAEEMVTRREMNWAEQLKADERSAGATHDALQYPNPPKQKMTEGTVIGERPSALETALEKQRTGRSFDMTAEEKIALQSMGKKSAGLLDQYGKPVGTMAVAGGLATLYQQDPEKAKELGLLGGALLMTHGKIGEDVLRQPTSPLGVARKASEYSLLTLERLPQNRTEFPKSMIAEQLKRADVTKAEKDVFQQIMDATPDDKISAVELVKAVKNATGDWELTPKETVKYADYGMQNIDRGVPSWDPRSAEAGDLNATTTLYQLPEHMEMSDANHFNDPRLFGWTRSFVENGVKHVVEIQSDLAQHAKGVVSEAERAKLLENLSRLTAEREAAWARATSDHHTVADQRAYNELSNRIEEIKIKLNATAVDSQVGPMLKNWPKRLVREELAKAQKEGGAVARFATADTVAKVEGWPEGRIETEQRLADLRRQLAAAERGVTGRGGIRPDVAVRQLKDLIAHEESILEGLKGKPRFSPEHQSIYDRYQKDIEKFLRQQGGVDYTDSAGHTWIEVPTSKFKGPKQMFGKADPALLARLALIGGGALAGAAMDKDNHWVGGLLGALGGATLASAGVPRIVQGVKDAFKADTRLRVDDLANAHEVATKRAARTIAALQSKIESLVPKLERRVAMTHAIETGDMTGLSGAEQRAVGLARDFFAQMSKAGLDSGVLKNSLDNYVTHLWGTDEKTKGILESIFGEKAGGPSMSPESRFALRRSVPTIAEGKAQGMTPLTEDLSAILGIYGNSIIRSMENKVMLQALRNQEVPGTKQKLVMPAAKAPAGYVPIQHPQMAGMLVHPDIAPSLRFIFDNRAPGVIQSGLLGLNTLTKRMAVSFSLFHAKALTDALAGAASNPLTVIPTAVRSLTGKNPFLKMLREGGAGDLVDKAILGGVQFSMRAEAGLEELNNTFYRTFQDLQKTLDETIPYSGAPIGGFIKLNHLVDKWMWTNLHAGMKISIFAEKYEKLLRNNREANAKDPSVKLKSEEEIAKIAGSFTNDIFGGINWRRAAEDAKTRWGRDIKLAAFGPTGRRVMQIGMFAPDWTVSTTRAALRAFTGEGTGIKGIFKPQEIADLHRQYILRSAVYYLVVGDAINYAWSGHHLWQNKDWSSIDLGDGRTMQWSKHTMEPVHWLTKPGQQAMNKLGYVPREVLNQAFGTEYLSTSGHAPKMDTSVMGRLGHATKGLSPISVQQWFQAGKGSGVAGFLGAPIYGRTYAEREAQKELMKEKRKETAADRKEKRLEARQ